MEIKKGIAVSPGISIAKSMVIDSEDYRITHRAIKPSQRTSEVSRVKIAFNDAVQELEQLEDEYKDKGSQIKDIFAVHNRFLRDKSLHKQINYKIRTELVTAEYAISNTFREIASHFANEKDTYISERAADITDIARRVLKHLLGKKREELGYITEEVNIIAHELSPIQTASFDKKYVKGIASDVGGRTSHAAIVARSLGIPAVVALEDLTSIISPNDTVIVDGNRGIVIVNPDEKTLTEYQEYREEFTELGHKLNTLREKPALTRDGTKVTLLGNIEFPNEAEGVIEKGGLGIGLYRTEFLYLNTTTEPTEEDHYKAYSHAIKTMGDKPVVIRTLDLGADKYTQSKRFVREPNPFLGLRSIRFCLQNQ